MKAGHRIIDISAQLISLCNEISIALETSLWLFIIGRINYVWENHRAVILLTWVSYARNVTRKWNVCKLEDILEAARRRRATI